MHVVVLPDELQLVQLVLPSELVLVLPSEPVLVLPSEPVLVLPQLSPGPALRWFWQVR